MAYIHEGARASYVHWWTQQLYWVEQAYRWDKFRSAADDIGYLYPHLAKPRKKRRRYTRWGIDARWIRPWDISTSGESSFRQDGYELKVESTDAAWREHKQFKRDKAKRKQHRRYDHAGPWGKRMVHHKRRRHERHAIKSGRWEDITSGVQDIVRCWWD